jgi:hypothetical protein
VRLSFLSLFLTGGLLSSINLFAQPEHSEKIIIRLKNYERVEGWIKTGEIPLMLTVYKNDQDSIAVPVKFIKKISLKKENNKSARVTFFNNTFIGLLIGRTNSQSSYRSKFTAETVTGIKLNNYIWPGIGIGYDQYPEVSTLPFFMSLRGDLMKSWFTPFYFLDLGSAPVLGEESTDFIFQEAKGGLMYHIGGGFKVYSDSRLNIILAGGFKSQNVKFTRQIGGDQQEVINRTYRNFSFRIGVGF